MMQGLLRCKDEQVLFTSNPIRYLLERGQLEFLAVIILFDIIKTGIIGYIFWHQYSIIEANLAALAVVLGSTLFAHHYRLPLVALTGLLGSYTWLAPDTVKLTLAIGLAIFLLGKRMRFSITVMAWTFPLTVLWSSNPLVTMFFGVLAAVAVITTVWLDNYSQQRVYQGGTYRIISP